MAKLAVLCEHPSLQTKANEIAEFLCCPLLQRTETQPKDIDFVLAITEQGLELNQCHSRFKPLRIDFESEKFHWRKKTFGKNQPLAKAIGIKKDYFPNVLDVTAGLGRDGFLLHHLGCQVTLLERNPVLFCMLREALPDTALYNVNATDWLASCEQSFDVIYLDPMFPETNKSALVKKEMQMLHTLIGPDEDGDLLLKAALQHAKKRVVVKRHIHAPYLGEQQPTHSIKTKTTRWDVFVMTKSVSC